MPSIRRHVWRNFSAFWKSQVLWGLVLALITFAWQYHKGLISGSWKENLWAIAMPYVGIAALFLVLNAGHAIFRAEWKALRKQEHDEHRTNRKAEIEQSKPVVPRPNLQFSRVFLTSIFVGHEIDGHSQNGWVVEIRNELSNREIGFALNLRAQITYKDKENNLLQTICPARWGTYQPTEATNIRQGESSTLILAFDKGHWFSDLFNGVRLPDGAIFEVRLIDLDGNDMSEAQTFKFRTWGIGESKCSKV